ncbi:MAG: hypothetical protein QXO71_02865 [Candidatus Jordarchaeaceae archaeon]
MCKERTKRPRGQMFECPHCGYCGDRHVVAALNMALKPVPMWLELASQKAALCPRVTRIRVSPKTSPEEVLGRVFGAQQ